MFSNPVNTIKIKLFCFCWKHSNIYFIYIFDSSAITRKYENTTSGFLPNRTLLFPMFFRESFAHCGSLDQHSSPFGSSCSTLILLCFLVHWPGMWCSFITEAEATTSVSSPRGHRPLAWTGPLCVIITEWLSRTGSVAYGKSQSSGEKLASETEARERSSVETRLEGPGRGEHKRVYCVWDLSAAMEPDDNELGIFTVIQWVVCLLRKFSQRSWCLSGWKLLHKNDLMVRGVVCVWKQIFDSFAILKSW